MFLLPRRHRYHPPSSHQRRLPPLPSSQSIGGHSPPPTAAATTSCSSHCRRVSPPHIPPQPRLPVLLPAPPPPSQTQQLVSATKDGLNKKTYVEAGVDVEGNSPGSYKEPGIGWMTGFLFVTSFVGLLALVPLRKQVVGFTKFLSASFVWGCFQWFYSGSGTCGFTSFPTFGLKAFKSSCVFVVS
ncbi:hypothetical protein Hanom_Chr11g01010171 [Helianthus anomalus]